jgi:hypothetical protein
MRRTEPTIAAIILVIIAMILLVVAVMYRNIGT